MFPVIYAGRLVFKGFYVDLAKVECRYVDLAKIFRFPPPQGGGESEKLRKGGGSMLQGRVFLKGGAGTFPI